MMTEVRTQRVDSAIARAMATLADVKASRGAAPMAKAATLSDGITRTVAAAVARAFDTGETLHPLAKATSGENSPKVYESRRPGTEESARAAIEAVSWATGERDPEKIAAMIERALAEPVDLFDRDAAVVLCKTAYAEGPMPAPINGVALERARERVKTAEMLKANGVNVHPDQLRSLYSDADALEVLSAVQPTRLGNAAPPYVDRRAEIRERLQEARDCGDAGGASLAQHELAVAEARHATRTSAA